MKYIVIIFSQLVFCYFSHAMNNENKSNNNENNIVSSFNNLAFENNVSQNLECEKTQSDDSICVFSSLPEFVFEQVLQYFTADELIEAANKFIVAASMKAEDNGKSSLQGCSENNVQTDFVFVITKCLKRRFPDRNVPMSYVDFNLKQLISKTNTYLAMPQWMQSRINKNENIRDLFFKKAVECKELIKNAVKKLDVDKNKDSSDSYPLYGAVHEETGEIYIFYKKAYSNFDKNHKAVDPYKKMKCSPFYAVTSSSPGTPDSIALSVSDSHTVRRNNEKHVCQTISSCCIENHVLNIKKIGSFVCVNNISRIKKALFFPHIGTNGCFVTELNSGIICLLKLHGGNFIPITQNYRGWQSPDLDRITTLALDGTIIRMSSVNNSEVRIHRLVNNINPADPDFGITYTYPQDFNLPNERDIKIAITDFIHGEKLYYENKLKIATKLVTASEDGLINIWTIPEAFIFTNDRPHDITNSTNLKYPELYSSLELIDDEDWNTRDNTTEGSWIKFITEMPLSRLLVAYGHNKLKIWEPVYEHEQHYVQVGFMDNLGDSSKLVSVSENRGKLIITMGDNSVFIWSRYCDPAQQ